MCDVCVDDNIVIYIIDNDNVILSNLIYVSTDLCCNKSSWRLRQGRLDFLLISFIEKRATLYVSRTLA